MVNRRSLLRALGFSPIAAPLAAKAAQDQIASQLIGIGPLPGGPGPGMPGSMEMPAVASDDTPSKLARWLRTKVLPGWYEEELREQCRYVYGLDADIACKRAWSLSVKIQHQRERNFERRLKAIVSGPERNELAAQFRREYGFWI